MWNKKEMSELDAMLTRVPLTLNFDIDLNFQGQIVSQEWDGETSEANFFKLHMVDLWVWENILAPISVTLGQGH